MPHFYRAVLDASLALTCLIAWLALWIALPA